MTPLLIALIVATEFPHISTPNANDIVKPATGGNKPPERTTAPTRAPSIRDAWLLLDKTRNNCDERELHFDYWPNGGVRNFFCHAKSVFTWRTLLELSPHKPFLRGPHGDGTNALVFDSKHDFGRYNPAFVRWLVDNLIPAATDAAFRAQTQHLYDRYVKQLAHAYAAVYAKMKKNPSWVERQRKLYLKTMDEKDPDWGAFYIRYSEYLGDADHNWGGHDPNHVSAAVAFWLRRTTDNTAPLFHEGLTKLIKTYEAK